MRTSIFAQQAARCGTRWFHAGHQYNFQAREVAETAVKICNAEPREGILSEQRRVEQHTEVNVVEY